MYSLQKATRVDQLGDLERLTASTKFNHYFYRAANMCILKSGEMTDILFTLVLPRYFL